MTAAVELSTRYPTADSMLDIGMPVWNKHQNTSPESVVSAYAVSYDIILAYGHAMRRFYPNV